MITPIIYIFLILFCGCSKELDPDITTTDLFGVIVEALATACASNPKIPAPLLSGKFHLSFDITFVVSLTPDVIVYPALPQPVLAI